jgi:hypothetical protein
MAQQQQKVEGLEDPCGPSIWDSAVGAEKRVHSEAASTARLYMHLLRLYQGLLR